MSQLARVLPTPGPVWGAYPLRASDDLAPPWRWPRWRSALAQARHVAQCSRQHALDWSRLDAQQRVRTLQSLRARLRHAGLQPDTVAQALGIASALAGSELALEPREPQLLAAAALLDNRMAEMATGEGKTLAIALAASVAALAGVPVHVVTANDYLAARDAATMAPLYRALGLRAAALGATLANDARRVAYGCDIVHTTAKELAFDFLRDRQLMLPDPARQAAAALCAAGSAAAPVLRGLCMAILDEADSILLDEAELPLVLSRSAPQAARRAFLWQALALARQLQPQRDFAPYPADRLVRLSPAGEQRLAELADALGGPWARRRYRNEAVTTALAGLHLYQRNAHYVVRNGSIELLDEVTGRVAPGRVWSRGLHTIVALKEGLQPPPETDTVAQTTFQRFFLRYWRLCGISGTLWEARGELGAVYGARVVRVPLHRPLRRRQLPAQRFAGKQQLFEAVVALARQCRAQGRPLLVGTDSVEDSQHLSALLAADGLEHQVLNALQDAGEAAIVAQAGHAGCITVATRMAGRGTDITLDDAARAAGGLHVLCCQHNSSRRLDRQLAGRSGRHGDPGSHQAWSSDAERGPGTPDWMLAAGPWNKLAALPATAALALAPKAWAQWREERRRAVLRHHLLQEDLQWERRLAFAGPAV